MSATTIAALYDQSDRAAAAAAELQETQIPYGIVHRIDPGGGDEATLREAGVPDSEIEHYADSLRQGWTLVTVQAEASAAAAVNAILHEHQPVEAAIHAAEAEPDGDLPAAVRSVADLSGRPHGHRDPSA